jgi:hypothetical protein
LEDPDVDGKITLKWSKIILYQVEGYGLDSCVSGQGNENKAMKIWVP